MEKEPLLTVEQVAGRLCVDDETVRRWLREGQLQGYRLGSRWWRVSEADLSRFLEAARKSASG
jgi:excisionase family DNA binding protein